MYCIVRLERRSPSFELEPTGWVVKETIEDVIKHLKNIGYFELAEKLGRLKDNLGRKYLLDDRENIWLLVD